MSTRSVVVAVVACLFLETGAWAWDGRRSGFVLGFGVGPGVSWVEGSDTTASEGTRHTDTAGMSLATDMRIGYAFNDQFMLYFTHKMSLFDFDGLGDNFEKLTDLNPLLQFILFPLAVPFLPVVSSHNAFGAGATYYLEPQAPSIFFDGGLGFMPFQADVRFLPGFGGYAGLGYEPTDHVSIGCQIMFGMGMKTDDEFEPKHDYEGMALSGLLTIRILGY